AYTDGPPLRSVPEATSPKQSPTSRHTPPTANQEAQASPPAAAKTRAGSRKMPLPMIPLMPMARQSRSVRRDFKRAAPLPGVRAWQDSGQAQREATRSRGPRSRPRSLLDTGRLAAIMARPFAPGGARVSPVSRPPRAFSEAARLLKGTDADDQPAHPQGAREGCLQGQGARDDPLPAEARGVHPRLHHHPEEAE